ncbi:enamine deaminase RidA (YjgF/YER057c/UK114 family) [Nitrospirillum amazonense]|uniref:Enamine deaminase RidA (YjgF/YER057c/UK114 family) n=2 Tax=Nitrospirillum amazonense TaxID=28077 RepID=A0A560ESV6_9PROT|nr:enamine deaminase RidA (YjgF/YER057c/UK114 family) [Nitrospirillum amazonense]
MKFCFPSIMRGAILTKPSVLSRYGVHVRSLPKNASSFGCGLVLAVLVFPVSFALAQTPAAPIGGQPPNPTRPAAAQAVGNMPDCAHIKPSNASQKIKYLNPETLFETQSYSIAASAPLSGKIVFISGQIPVDIQYGVVADDLVGQVKAALDNLCRVLQAGQISKDDIIKIGITYVHKDASDPFAIAEQMSAFFGREQMPVTTMMGVDFLITDKIRFQIEATAVTD